MQHWICFHCPVVGQGQNVELLESVPERLLPGGEVEVEGVGVELRTEIAMRMHHLSPWLLMAQKLKLQARMGRGCLCTRR